MWVHTNIMWVPPGGQMKIKVGAKVVILTCSTMVGEVLEALNHGVLILWEHAAEVGHKIILKSEWFYVVIKAL